MEEDFYENIPATDENIDHAVNDERVEKIIECAVLEDNMELLDLEDNAVDKHLLGIFKLKSEAMPSVVTSPRPTTTNRRYSLRPQKRPESTDCDEYAVSANKKRRLSPTKNGFLETIFETPVCKNGSLMFLGKAKLKRTITFSDFVTKAKIRLRKSKIKRLSKGKAKKSGKVTVEDVRLKLKCLDESNEEDEWMDI